MLRKNKIPGLLLALGLCLALLPAVVAAAEGDAPAADAVSREESHAIQAAVEFPALSEEFTYAASAQALLAGSGSETASDSDAKGDDASSTDAPGSGGTSGILGDINGDKTINTADLLRLMKYLCGDKSVGDLSVTGDVNGDGRVDARDLFQLLKFVNGQITSLR